MIGRRTAARRGPTGNLGLGTLAALTWSLVFSSVNGEAGAQSSKPAINVATVVLAEPAVETPLPIQIGSAEGMPHQTFVRIRGLPGSVSLSEGHSIAAGSWAIPLSGLPRLRMLTPMGITGKSEITISLVSIDGNILNEVKATLLIVPAAALTPSAREVGGLPVSANTASLGPTGIPTPRTQSDATPTPAAPPPPQIKADDREQALKHMQRGDDSMAAGNITVARLFYQRAADLGWGPGALSLAATYDPNELAKLNVLGGVQPDRQLALKWYEKARALGATEAVDRLQRLGNR
jgi:hypothetical protein